MSSLSRPGVFTRLLALIIDLFFLFLIGLVLGNLFTGFFSNHVVIGHILGWFLATAYFGVFNSNLIWGMTLGKLLMRLQTLDHQGEELKWPKALIRSQFVVVPWILVGQHIPDASLMPWAKPLLLMVVNGTFLVQAACMVFLRRSFHDFILRTQVINSGTEAGKVSATPGTLWPPIVVIYLACLIWPFTPIGHPIKPRAAALEPAYEIIESQPWVLTFDSLVPAHPYKVKEAEQDEHQQYLLVSLFMRGYPESEQQPKQLADQLHQQLAPVIELPQELQGLLIEIRYGYDVGLASSWKDQEFTYKK